MNKLILLVFCHLVGDYVLQNDFIAKNKGSNWYHLFVHCALYCLPFYPMRRKTPCFSYGDIRRVHRIYASN